MDVGRTIIAAQELGNIGPGKAGRVVITPPLIVVDTDGELEIFRSPEAAGQQLEAIDVENGEYVAYDAIGRRLRLEVMEQRRPSLFGLTKMRTKEVRVEAAEDEPGGVAGLRAALEGSLEKLGMAPEELRAASMEELIAEAVTRIGISG